MFRISEEEYRSLELKIHEEVHKVFTRFLEDLEQKKTGANETLTI